jgi:hypothetical protein
MKARTLDPDFWDDAEIVSLSRDEQRIVMGMILKLADDEGQLQGHAPYIKKEIFGYSDDVTVLDVERMLQSIFAGCRGIRAYYENGHRYIYLHEFTKRQGIRYTIASKLPKYDKSKEINECGKFPKIPENSCSSRVGLGRVGLSSVDTSADAAVVETKPDDTPEETPTESLTEWQRQVRSVEDLCREANLSKIPTASRVAKWIKEYSFDLVTETLQDPSLILDGRSPEYLQAVIRNRRDSPSLRPQQRLMVLPSPARTEPDDEEQRQARLGDYECFVPVVDAWLSANGPPETPADRTRMWNEIRVDYGYFEKLQQEFGGGA